MESDLVSFVCLPSYRYASSSWQDKDVAGTVGEGLEFSIDAKVTVNGSSQYKVHNSKGKIYYVTTNEAYVYLKLKYYDNYFSRGF